MTVILIVVGPPKLAGDKTPALPLEIALGNKFLAAVQGGRGD